MQFMKVLIDEKRNLGRKRQYVGTLPKISRRSLVRHKSHRVARSRRWLRQASSSLRRRKDSKEIHEQFLLFIDEQNDMFLVNSEYDLDVYGDDYYDDSYSFTEIDYGPDFDMKVKRKTCYCHACMAEF